MTITSKPASKEYRDNFEATFGETHPLPKSFAELRPICKFCNDAAGTCGFFAHKAECKEPCPAFGAAVRLSLFVKGENATLR